MPDFIGIGSGKSGTTWIYDMIAAHPEVHNGHAKEINFFSSDMPYYDKGLRWYEAHFEHNNGKVTGEFSVSYLYDKIAIERIHHNYPQAKLIVSIRDPIGRAKSDFFHDKRKGRISIDRDFKTYIERDYDHKYGHYWQYIDMVYSIVPRENVLVIPYELISKNPQKILMRLYMFIGVSADFLPENFSSPINQGFVPKIAFFETSMTRVSYWLTKKGFVDFLQALKKTGIHTFVRSLNKGQKAELKISDKLQEQLLQIYKDDISFIEKTMQDWNAPDG